MNKAEYLLYLREGKMQMTIEDLYASTVKLRGVVKTKDSKVQNVKVVGFPGVRTLLCTAEVIGSSGREAYTMELLFGRVNYTKEKQKGFGEIEVQGEKWYYELPTTGNNPVQVRCSCPDYRFRFAWYNKQQGAMYGRDFTKYQKVAGSNRGPANPLKTPGVCSHIANFVEKLGQMGVIRER